jgi:predicted DNA-binding WGR domain protein
MRLIRQITLYLREGTADKVYEVDLCEAGDGEFVVNFRYGRRGTTLREGTKTTFPVDRAEAEDVYEKLVESKTVKGYSTAQPEEGPAPISRKRGDDDEEKPRSIANDPRARRVLRYLKTAALGDDAPSEGWSLSRILWRAGEMGLREAAPYLGKIAATGDDMHDVSLAWALGR